MTLLETIKRLENRKTLSKEDEELVEYLNSQALKEINNGLMNLMAYGNRLGWAKIEVKLQELLGFVQKAKDSSSNEKQN